MKLLYIALGNGINPAVGGSLTRSGNIAKKMLEKGHQVSFATTIGGERALQSLGVTANFIRVPCWLGQAPQKERGRPDRLLANIVSAVAAPVKVAKAGKFDLFYTDSDYFFDIIPAVLLKLLGRGRWVAMIHHQIAFNAQSLSTAILSAASIAAQRLSWVSIGLLADTVLVYHTPMGKHIAEKLSLFSKIRRLEFNSVDNGIDPKFIKSVKPSKEHYDACFVGGMRPGKGMYEILPIWKKVCKAKRKATLAIVGAGLKEYTDWFQKEIKARHMESNIKLIGALPNRETLAVVKASSIFFFPSREEGFGIALAEALACQKQVVAYNLPVYRDTFAPFIKTIPLWDREKFAAETVKLLKNPTKNPNNILQKLDWARITDNEEKIFKKVTLQTQKQAQLFDKEFSNYKKYHPENWQKSYFNRINRHLSFGKGKRYLDIGCGGMAYMPIEAAKRGADSFGLDISKVAIEKARTFAKSEGVEKSANFVNGGAEKLPFKDNAFNAISSIAVLEHLTYDQKAVSEMARVCQKGGKVFVAVPNAYINMPLYTWLAYFIHDRRIGHLRHYSAKDLTALFEATGFRLVTTFTSAHNVKFLQLILHRILKNEKLWWQLERRDMASHSKIGVTLNAVFEKK
ncbi:MAG: glycosyltransferase [bacterium]